MMKTIYFNSTFAALALSSYLAETNPRQLSFCPLTFDNQTIVKFLKDPEAVVCLSIGSLGDLRLAENLFYLVRQTRLKPSGFPKFILGGAVFSYIDCQQFLDYYPEISYIVIGEGYHALDDILNNQPQHDIVQGEDYPEIDNVLLQKVLYWHPERPVPVSLGETNCSWGKCRFCHHLDKEHAQRLSIEEFCERLIHYFQKFNWRNFYIYDNHLEPEELEAILLYLQKHKIKLDLDVFGMRLKKSFIPLARLLRETKMVRYIGWGLEMYSQSVLNLYRKGVQIRSVLPILKAAAEGGAKSIVYILLGLPGCYEDDYADTHRFLQKHLQQTGFINQVLINWFLMSSPLVDNMSCKDIVIKLKDRFFLNQYFGNSNELARVDTVFNAFDHWDHQTRTWISRDDALLRQRKVLSDLLTLPSTAYDFRSFFINNITWREFWGDHYNTWLNAHLAPIPRLEKPFRPLQTVKRLSANYQTN